MQSKKNVHCFYDVMEGDVTDFEGYRMSDSFLFLEEKFFLMQMIWTKLVPSAKFAY